MAGGWHAIVSLRPIWTTKRGRASSSGRAHSFIPAISSDIEVMPVAVPLILPEETFEAAIVRLSGTPMPVPGRGRIPQA